MNKVKFIIVILAALISSIFAHTYVATDPGDGADFDAKLAAATIAAGEIGLVKADGSAIESVACSSLSGLKGALEADTSSTGASAGLKHGSCCINAHHVVCQRMQDAIRSCAHEGKGDDSLDATKCPS